MITKKDNFGFINVFNSSILQGEVIKVKKKKRGFLPTYSLPRFHCTGPSMVEFLFALKTQTLLQPIESSIKNLKKVIRY